MRTILINKFKFMDSLHALAGGDRRMFVLRAAGRIVWPRGLFCALGLCLITAVQAAPPRLVAIGGSVTETVFALDAGDQVVAVDTSSTYPPVTAELPKVGYARTLAAEGILAMRPDHVLAAEHAGPEAVFEQLRGAGISVTRVPDPRSAEDTVAMIETLATLLNRPEQGQILVSNLRASLQGLAGMELHPRDAIVVIGGQGGQVMVAGQGTAADAMLTLVGARNAADQFRGYRPVGDESLLQLAPDAVIVPDHALRTLGGLDGLRARPGLAPLPDHAFIVMDSLLLLGMGPRMGDAAQSLARSLDVAGP